MIVGLWTWLLVLGPLVQFAPTAVTCPSPADVEAQLVPLLASAPPQAARDLATLERQGATLRVTVQRPDGTLVGRRTFEGAFPCADLASAVALAIATWESDVHPEFVFALPAVDEAGRGARGAAAPPAGAVTIAGAPPVAERRTALGFDVGAAITAHAAPSTSNGSLELGLAPGLSVLGGIAPEESGWGGRLALGLSTERVVPLADAEARWRRAAAMLGGLRRVRPGGSTAIDLHGELAVAALNVRGAGLSPNVSTWSLDLGGAAGARVWLGRGRWRPSIDLGLTYWPRTHVAYASPSTDGARLPRLDLFVALGLSFVGRLTRSDGP